MANLKEIPPEVLAEVATAVVAKIGEAAGAPGLDRESSISIELYVNESALIIEALSQWIELVHTRPEVVGRDA